MIVLLFLAAFTETDPLTRITYDLVVETPEQSITLRMVVNLLDENHLSISCRKAPSGTVFTYWATPERNVLKIPREKVMYEGPAADPFMLFPDGPLLRRAEWLALLEGESPEDMEGFHFRSDKDWREVRHPRDGWAIRWRERGRRSISNYRQTVLVPVFPMHYRLDDLGNVVSSWQSDEND